MKTPLSQFLNKRDCQQFKERFGIEYLEDTERLTDEEIYKSMRGWGKIRIAKLRNFRPVVTGYPHREICGLCHRVSPVGFHVPNAVWEAVVHESHRQDIHCLTCFIERADEKLIEWSVDIQFYPVSLASHLKGIDLLK